MVKKGKGKKGKKGKKEVQVTDELTEVERELFQIQIADLTRKVERLKARCLELELSNEEFEKNYATLDEDRADIISYLKRVTQQKTEEIEELEERIDGLIKSGEADVIMYKEKIKQMEHDFKIMHEQLTSEIKLLSGKLNSLEEFRIQRDELMKKFKQQENSINEQEDRHKRTLYEVERKFIIGKDKLKKEMESRLLQLSTDFQDVTEIRIAATTQHTIRENIAINNELDLMLETTRKLMTENDKMRVENKDLHLQVQLLEDEKHTAVAKNLVHVKLIQQLSTQNTDMRIQIGELQYLAGRLEQVQLELDHQNGRMLILEQERRIVDQQLHASHCEHNELRMQVAEERFVADRLKAVIDQSVIAIKEAVELQISPTADEAYILSRREGLLSRLLELMDMVTIENIAIEDSTTSMDVYQTGDLGLIPKSDTDIKPDTSFQTIPRSDTSLQKLEEHIGFEGGEEEEEEKKPPSDTSSVYNVSEEEEEGERGEGDESEEGEEGEGDEGEEGKDGEEDEEGEADKGAKEGKDDEGGEEDKQKSEAAEGVLEKVQEEAEDSAG